MKKAIAIIVLGLLWCNISFANIDDLDIPITKAEFETEVIKPNKEYRQSCETDITSEGDDMAVKYISYVDVAGKKQTLINEIIIDLGDDGKVIIKTEEKIKLDGKLSKPKTKSEYIPGTVEYSKKEIKQVKKMLKLMAELVSFRAINYGEKATPGINREDGIKVFSKMLKKMGKYMFPGEDPKEVKEFLNIIKKDIKFELVKDYLGTTELNGEKFYAIRWKGIVKYLGDIPELKEPMEAMSTDLIHFIHTPSGYRSAVKVLISSEEAVAEAMEDSVCTIYKNDQMLTEVSISELEDIAVAEKAETKKKPEKKEKKVVKKKKETTQTQQVVETVDLRFCSGKYGAKLSNQKCTYKNVSWAATITFEEFKERRMNGFETNRLCITEDLKEVIYNHNKPCYSEVPGSKLYNLEFIKKKSPTNYEFSVVKKTSNQKEPTQTQQVAENKPDAYFCTYKYAQKSLNPPANIYKLGTFESDRCPLGKKISMKEYVDMVLSWYLKHPSYNFDSENGYISFLKSFKRTFTKYNLDTTYLDGEIIKNYSDKLNKNKILTALNIVKEPTQTDDSSNVVQQLKDLNEFYESGALTEEEFKKAKKKLLN